MTIIRKLFLVLFLLAFSCKNDETVKNKFEARKNRTNKMYKKRPSFKWLDNGELVRVETYNQQEFESLMNKYDGIKEQELSSGYKTNIYRLSNGHYMVSKFGNFYGYYFSESDLLKSVNDRKDKPEISICSILFNKNPYNERFPENTEVKIDELMKELKISKFQLDSEALRKVDEKINSMTEEDSYKFRYKFFLNMIAIVGEVYRKAYRKYNPSWNMMLDEYDNKTWTPYIEIKGNIISFISYLKEDMFDETETDYPLLEAFETMRDITKINLKID
jgi:hypothetical protein